jgi:hypothetical protein
VTWERVIAPSGEPWKELVRHRADQTRLSVHGKGPNNLDINWLFAAPKLKRIPCFMWKSIVGTWLNVRPGLTKVDPINTVETLRQPLFGNPSITNVEGAPLGVSGLREGCAFARSGYSRVKDLWNPKRNEWKSLSELGMSYHIANISYKDIISASFPWRPDVPTSCAQVGDWINNLAPSTGAPFDWVYHVLESTPGKANIIEFKKTSISGRIQAMSHQALTLTITTRSVSQPHFGQVWG